MAGRARWRNRLRLGFASTLVGGTLAGCNGNKDATTDVQSTDKPPPAVSVSGGVADPGSAPTGAMGETKTDRLNQPFAEACTVEINADSGVVLPPTLTLNGQNSGQLNEDVQRLWSEIKFVVANGKRQTYALDVEVVQDGRDLGTIEILMRPEVAPNHVRNFVALAMLKFYDGLRFDRIVRQQGEGDNAGSKLVLLEAGSPVENGDPAASHLGYWLRPEFTKDVKHEEGAVGACLLECEDNAETAACRFYINLTAAPAMDENFTIFGKVTRGLDLARKLAEQPVKDKDGGPDQGRPVTPIVIRKASVRVVPVIE